MSLSVASAAKEIESLASHVAPGCGRFSIRKKSKKVFRRGTNMKILFRALG
jgi:hypothetical protein